MVNPQNHQFSKNMLNKAKAQAKAKYTAASTTTQGVSMSTSTNTETPQPDWVKIDDSISKAIEALKELIVHESCEQDVPLIMEALQNALNVIHPTAEKIRIDQQIEELKKKRAEMEKKEVIKKLQPTTQVIGNLPGQQADKPNRNGTVYPEEVLRKGWEEWIKQPKQFTRSDVTFYQVDSLPDKGVIYENLNCAKMYIDSLTDDYNEGDE